MCIRDRVGCVKPPYINGMIRREQETSTDSGWGVMIPHGTEDTLNFVLKPGISIVQIPHGVSYHGDVYKRQVLSCDQWCMHVYKITFLKEFMDRICNLRTNSEYRCV